jgi:hypothetical protein
MGWVKLGSTKLTGAGDTITVDNLTAKKFLRIECYIIGSGTIHPKLRFNADTGSNYTSRTSTNGGADWTDNTQTGMRFGAGTNAVSEYISTYVTNESSKEKLAITEMNYNTSTGAGNAPLREESVGKWVNTSDQITRIDVVNTQSGDFAIGSEVVVHGSSTPTTNYPNLSNGAIYEESDTGKIYMFDGTSAWNEM